VGCVCVDLMFFSFFFWREPSTRISYLTFCVPDEMLTCGFLFLVWPKIWQ
jgi:hypothetical protein